MVRIMRGRNLVRKGQAEDGDESPVCYARSSAARPAASSHPLRARALARVSCLDRHRASRARGREWPNTPSQPCGLEDRTTGAETVAGCSRRMNESAPTQSEPSVYRLHHDRILGPKALLLGNHAASTAEANILKSSAGIGIITVP